MITQDKFNKLVKFFFMLQLHNKLYHWNTTSFARHKATDGFDDALQGLLDRFVEVFVGRYKMKPQINDIKIDATYLTDDGAVRLFEASKTVLEELSKDLQDSDLLNIRDELLAEVNKTLYLFRLA